MILAFSLMLLAPTVDMSGFGYRDGFKHVVGPRWSDWVMLDEPDEGPHFKWPTRDGITMSDGRYAMGQLVFVSVTCPDELIGCLVNHTEGYEVVGMSPSLWERWEKDRREMVAASFCWRGGTAADEQGDDLLIVFDDFPTAEYFTISTIADSSGGGCDCTKDGQGGKKAK